jgi:predicted RNA-binding Zn-ribbon protein involved in translation (DUF1610 family)
VSHLDNWDEGAIMVDVPVTATYELHNVSLPCPWCGRHHFMVCLQNYQRSIKGHHLCDNCGEFFRFDIENLESRTLRSRARLKLREGG